MAKYFLLNDDEPRQGRGSLAKRCLGPLTTGGVRQSMFTLISGAVGGGILCLPYAFSLTGFALGSFIICFVGFVAYVTIRMLLVSAGAVHVYSYGSLLAEAINIRYSGMFLDVVMVLFGFGVVVAYFVFLGDFIPSLLGAVGDITVSRESSIILCCIFAVPFSIPRKLSSLQYITPVSTFTLLITSAVEAYRTPAMRYHLGNNQIGGTSISSQLKAFAIVTSAFICHSNVVSVAGELVMPTQKRANKVAFRTASVQVALYLALAICGYSSFGDAVEQNFVKNYPSTDSLITVCRCLLSLAVFFGLLINVNPIANSFCNVVKNAMVPKAIEKIRISAGIVILILGACISLAVPGVADIISFLGGSLGALIMLVFPSLIFIRICSHEMSHWFNQLAVAVTLVSAIICFSCVAQSLPHT